MKIFLSLFFLAVVGGSEREDVTGETVSTENTVYVGGPPKGTTHSFQSRIVGGTITRPGDYPYYANYGGGCGATLIYEDIVLSAAHCNSDDVFQVIVGDFDRDDENDGVRRNIVEKAEHPSYNSDTVAYDFLILKLDRKVDLSPAILNDKDDFPSPGTILTTIGLGTTSQGGSVSTRLRKVDVPAVSQRGCEARYGRGQIIEDVMLCAGHTAGGKDSCQGDSGGPLVKEIDQGDDVLVGVVSWGDGCAQPNVPGVYARVSGVIDWIREKVCELSSNPPDTCGDSTPSTTCRPTPSPVSVPATRRPTPSPAAPSAEPPVSPFQPSPSSFGSPASPFQPAPYPSMGSPISPSQPVPFTFGSPESSPYQPAPALGPAPAPFGSPVSSPFEPAPAPVSSPFQPAPVPTPFSVPAPFPSRNRRGNNLNNADWW